MASKRSKLTLEEQLAALDAKIAKNDEEKAGFLAKYAEQTKALREERAVLAERIADSEWEDVRNLGLTPRQILDAYKAGNFARAAKEAEAGQRVTPHDA